MNESEAIVQRVDGQYIWIDFQSAGCADCKESGSCGINNGQGRRLQRYRNDIGARVGDTVILSIPEGAVMKAVFQCYLLPLLLIIFLSVTGATLANEAGAVAGAVAGLLLGWYNLRRLGQQRSQLAIRLKTDIVAFQRRIRS